MKKDIVALMNCLTRTSDWHDFVATTGLSKSPSDWAKKMNCCDVEMKGRAEIAWLRLRAVFNEFVEPHQLSNSDYYVAFGIAKVSYDSAWSHWAHSSWPGWLVSEGGLAAWEEYELCSSLTPDTLHSCGGLRL